MDSQGKRPLLQHPDNLLILHAFNLCVLGVLGAILFPAPKRVRAKDAKLAKGKKANLPSPLTIQVGGRLGWRGPPGSVSPATTEAAGGWRLGDN